MKTVKKTITNHHVTIRDVKTGEILKSFHQDFKPNKGKVKVDFVKETGYTAFDVEIVETSEVYEMPLDQFLQLATFRLEMNDGTTSINLAAEN